MLQQHGESDITFASRIKELGLRIIEAYKYANQPDVQTLEAFNNDTQNNLTIRFQKGLLPEIEQRLTIGGTLGEVARMAIKIDKELSSIEKRYVITQH